MPCQGFLIIPAAIPAVRGLSQADKNTATNTYPFIRKRYGLQPRAATGGAGRKHQRRFFTGTRCAQSAPKAVGTSRRRSLTTSCRTGETKNSSGMRATGSRSVNPATIKRPAERTADQPTGTEFNSVWWRDPQGRVKSLREGLLKTGGPSRVQKIRFKRGINPLGFKTGRKGR